MRSIPIIVLLAFATPAVSAEIGVGSSIESVLVYPDGATVTRVIRVDLPSGDSTLLARDFPPTLDPMSLRVAGEGPARLVIGAIDSRQPRSRPPILPGLEQRIEALKDARAKLDDAIAAATARRKFAERFAESVPAGLGEKAEARPLAEWRAAFTAIEQEVSAANTVIREARLEQRDIDRELARLEAERSADPPRKTDVRIDLAADAPASATLRISYTVRGARRLPLYDARLDTGGRTRKPALELVRRAEIVQNTGEDWTDVALAVSTVRTAKGGNAPDLSPLVVRYHAPRPAAEGYRAAQPTLKTETQRSFEDDARVAAREREAILDAGGFQAVFRVPGPVSIVTGEGAKSFRISGATISPDLLVRATPAIDDTAYLEATFKQNEEAPLLPGRIALYRDDIYVGRGQMALTPKDETVRLGFGADEKIKVTRAVVRKSEGSTGIFTSAKVDEREYKIVVRNGHGATIRVMVEDQMPVSEIADVQVELLPATTAPSERNVKDRRGVLAWNFDAAAGEAREIKLAWRVRWPVDKAIVYDPAPRS